ncbi:MAG: carboxypeptidase M32 [Lachnospiraceae bacterium]|nr:carboxypeptidase M32 [Lachnospiraceae bacterium]
MNDQTNALKEGLKQYTERMKEIRLLSSPGIEEVSSADEYSEILRKNFRKIGVRGEEMKELDALKDVLRECEKYKSASLLFETDGEIFCPEKAMEDEAKIGVFLDNQAYRLRKSSAYIDHLMYAHAHRDALTGYDRVMVDSLYRRYEKEKNITPEKAGELSLLQKKAYIAWCRAREEADFSLFRDSLSALVKANREMFELRNGRKPDSGNAVYNMLIDDFERGFDTKKIDALFEPCVPRIEALVKKAADFEGKVRTDFLSRPVSQEDHLRVAKHIAGVMGFDETRGVILMANQAFTSRVTRNDVRMTTYRKPADLADNIFTVMHEAGHSLFEQLQPEDNYEYFIQGDMTDGMHESVARFYENIIGRSAGFMHFLYGELKRMLPGILDDVTERELYDAVNVAKPSLIRTEADELTYPLHIIIRYELEKDLLGGDLAVDELPAAWDEKYGKYLGVRPKNAKEGVLQDVHWTSDFAYFPTYLLGNIYGAMYYEKMQQDLDVETLLSEGNLLAVRDWMKEKVFQKANILAPAEWIYDITGKEISPEPYLAYLERKYT